MKNIVLMGFSVAVLAMIFAPTTAAMSHKVKIEQPEPVKIEPPEPVNAFLEGDVPFLYPYSDEKAEVELLVYIKDILQYSTEIEGDWKTYRYLVKCDVIEITVGQWADKELRFVCYDRWPTPESGIMLRKIPFPYSVNNVLSFKLQHQESSLPRIIRQEQRNPVPPHEPLRRPNLDSRDSEQREYTAALLNAARVFLEEQSESKIGVWRFVHEAYDYYVVESLRHKDSVGVSRYVVINKETLEAKSPPRPCPLAVDLKTPDDNRNTYIPLKIESPGMGHIDFIDHSAIPNLKPNWWTKRLPFLVPEGTLNAALHKPVSSSSITILGELSMITDGRKQQTQGYHPLVELAPGVQYVTIDLQAEHTLYAIVFWHFHAIFPVYKDIIIQVSNDPDFKAGVITLFNNDHDNSSGMGHGTDKNFVQMEEGKLVDAQGVQARYVRLYSNGSYQHDYIHYVEVEVYGIPVTDGDVPANGAEGAIE